MAKCFDNIILSDVTYDILEAGADRKTMEVVYDMSENNTIRIAGDPDLKRCTKVVRSVGQRTQIAPKESGLTIVLPLMASASAKDARINGDCVSTARCSLTGIKWG